MTSKIKIPNDLQPLLPFEIQILEALSKGEPCRAIIDNVMLNEVRAKLLGYLCTDFKISEKSLFKEIYLEGAYISGPLNLTNCEVKPLLSFINCYFPDPIHLLGAKLQSLNLQGSSIGLLDASRLHVQLGILLCETQEVESPKRQPFSASQEVNLNGAIINGNLFCDGGQFRGENGSAFDAENITIGNSFMLRRASIEGRLNIMNATIGSSLECDGLVVRNPEKTSIMAENINVKRNVHLRTVITAEQESDIDGDGFFISEGEIRLNNAVISGNLDCQRASFKNASGRAFTGDGMQVEGTVLFRNFLIADGEVRFYSARVGELDCTTAVFNNPEGTCFTGAFMNVKNALKWYRVQCNGKVSLYNSKVGNLIDTMISWPQKPGTLRTRWIPI